LQAARARCETNFIGYEPPHSETTAMPLDQLILISVALFFILLSAVILAIYCLLRWQDSKDKRRRQRKTKKDQKAKKSTKYGSLRTNPQGSKFKDSYVLKGPQVKPAS